MDGSPFGILSNRFRTSSPAARDAAPMKTNEKAAAFAGFAILALVAGCAAALALGRYEVPLIAAGFLAYVFGGRQAMILSHADDQVFACRDPGKSQRASSAVAAGLIAGTIASFALSQAARPQPRPLRRRSSVSPFVQDPRARNASTALPPPQSAQTDTPKNS